MRAVRSSFQPSRMRWRERRACCSGVFTATNRIVASRKRQGDGLGIIAVVLHRPALAVWLDELRGHDPRLQPKVDHPARPMMCGAARLQANQASLRQTREPRHQPIALELATLDHLTVAAHRAHREDRLCQIQPNRRNIHGETSPSF